MAGVRYGRLVGLRYAGRRGSHAHWHFQCDCGEQTIASGAAVRAGKTASCGCLHREISAARLTVHGRRARKRHDATYRAWQEINVYCTHDGSPRFRDFGARGVTVAAAWRDDFEAFLADMGERPAGAILARLDERGDFSPGNCQWIAARPRSERARNTRRSAPDQAASAAGMGSARISERNVSSGAPSVVVASTSSRAR